MSAPDHETLTRKIDSTRITYPNREHGVGISGSPFTCTFSQSVDPRAFCEDILTTDAPWQMFGVKTRLADTETDSNETAANGEYWKVVGTLFHVTNDDVHGSSKISLEIAPKWIRVYVKADCSASRVAEFIESIDDEYGVTVNFPNISSQSEKGDTDE